MDLLADVLAASGVRGALGNRLEAGGIWGLWLDDYPGAALHAVTVGTAWLTAPGHPPRELTTGDVVLLPAGTDHGLGNAPGTVAGPCDQAAAARARATGDALQLGSRPPHTRIVTVHYAHDPAVRTQVLTALPDLVHVGPDSGSACLDDTVRLLARELAYPQIAMAAVLNSMVDILLIQLLRAWITARPAQQQGSWPGVLSDPVVREAMNRIHQAPAHPWTTATLAAAISVSRATLSRRFPEAVGQTPAAYLTQWRMDMAALRLRDTQDSVETIAAAVGYTSVPAFSRAFSRTRGQAPGQYRADARH